MLTESERKRMEALEAEVAELKAKIPLPKKVISAAVEDEGAKTFFPRVTSIAMPSPKEFEKLFDIAARRFPGSVPEFRGEWDRAEFLKRLGLAFEHVASLRRTEKINEGLYLDVWASRASTWLRQQGSPSIETEHFFLAVVMAGDVPYRLQDRGKGIVLGFGLSTSSDGVKATSAGWRGVLERGAPRAPVQPVVRREHNAAVRRFA